MEYTLWNFEKNMSCFNHVENGHVTKPRGDLNLESKSTEWNVCLSFPEPEFTVQYLDRAERTLQGKDIHLQVFLLTKVWQDACVIFVVFGCLWYVM